MQAVKSLHSKVTASTALPIHATTAVLQCSLGRVKVFPGGEGEGGSQSKWLCCLSNQQDPAQKPILQVIDQTVYVPGEAP